MNASRRLSAYTPLPYQVCRDDARGRSVKVHCVRLSVLWLMSATSLVAAQVPPLPAVPTMDSCRAYMLDNHARRGAILREESDCLRTFPWNFGERYSNPICKWPPTRIVSEVSVYNCPQRAAELCALVDADALINECYQRARSTMGQLEEAQRRIKRFNELERKWNAVRNAKKDPRRLFWEIVEPRLSADTKARLGLAFKQTNTELRKRTIPFELTKSGDSLFVVHLFDRNGDYTQRGSSMMQETYDFVYARTLGNSHLFQTNPIISAIRGTAAEEIRTIHSSTIDKIDKDILESVDAILRAAPSANTSAQPESVLPRPATSAIRSHGPTDPACAVLDGPRAAELSIDSPEAFERLVKRCR